MGAKEDMAQQVLDEINKGGDPREILNRVHLMVRGVVEGEAPKAPPARRRGRSTAAVEGADAP